MDIFEVILERFWYKFLSNDATVFAFYLTYLYTIYLSFMKLSHPNSSIPVQLIPVFRLFGTLSVPVKAYMCECVNLWGICEFVVNMSL